MNSEQYKRANNNSFYVTIIIILSGLLLTVFSLFQYGATIGRISIIIDAFFCAGICALGNFKYPYEKKGSIMIMGGATIFYFVILIAEESLIYFAFGLPILICSIIYLNVRLCKFGISAIIISFIITCIKKVMVAGEFNLELKGAKDFKINMEQVVSEIRQICEADRCCVFLTDFKERKCSVLAKSITEGVEVAELEYVINTKYEDFFSIVETWPSTIAGSTCIIIKNSRDMEVLKERNPVWHESLVNDGVTSLVLFPLEYNEETLGYIWVANFEVENAMMIKEVLELTTQLIASEIANYQLVDKLKVMSSIDMLTGANVKR